MAIEKATVEKAQAEASEAEAKRKTEEDKAEKAKSEANIAKLEEEKKQRQSEQEKTTFAASAKMNKSAMQANAYISSYQLVNLLAQSIGGDGVVISLDGLTRTIAAVFGYDSYELLLNDKNFNNEKLVDLKYVLCDTDHLSKEFKLILDDEDIDHDEYESEWLIGHVEMVFEGLPYEFIYEDRLADSVYEAVETDRYSLDQEEVFASAQAETDSIIDEINLYDKSYDFSGDAFVVEIKGSGSGYHRKESGMPGRGVDFTLEAALPVKWGLYGLADYELTMVSASPEDFGDDGWEDEEIDVAVPSLVNNNLTENAE